MIVKKQLVLEMLVDESLEMILDELLDMILDESLDMIVDESLMVEDKSLEKLMDETLKLYEEHFESMIAEQVVKKEIVKLLDTGIIYPFADSPWVSPIHCVPKKGGITIVTNENDELVPKRTVTGWREATRALLKCGGVPPPYKSIRNISQIWKIMKDSGKVESDGEAVLVLDASMGSDSSSVVVEYLGVVGGSWSVVM
ncbi:hypothetical protein Tco_1226584 [Tanacetum coccineum]